MNSRTRLSLMAVAVAMVAGVLVGTVTGSGKAAAATQHTLRIPAAAFTPFIGVLTYYNYGQYLTNTGGTTAMFVAPVLLVGNSATIESVSVHYYDNGPDRLCVELIRRHLKSVGTRTMSTTCTRNAVDKMRTRTDTTIKPDTVDSDSATFLSVHLPQGNYGIAGVTIVYTSSP